MNYDLVVIGAGHAGCEAALAAAGFTILEHLHEEEWNAYICK